MKGKRILSLMAAFLLAAVTCLTVMTNVKPVYADAGDAAIQMGGGTIAAGDTVYYGSAGNQWRVLSLSGSGGTYSDGTNSVAADSALFLFSEAALFQTAFHDSENNYTNSTLRAKLNSRISDYFTAGEESALLFTTKGGESINLCGLNYSDPGLGGDRLFALSANELQGYLGYSRDPNSWKEGLSRLDWWLRSASDDNSSCAGAVITNGYTSNPYVDRSSIWARPAFNLNLNSVLFTSAAAGGKSSGAGGADALAEIGTNAGSEWKVTLKGLAPDFDVSYCPGTYDSGAITVKYSGADGNYISAIVTDSTGQTIKKYGKIASVSGAAGEVTINTAGKMDADAGDRLFVFCEQDNGDNRTDYASELKKITLPPTGHVWKEATCTEPKTCTICGATEGSANGHSFTYALSEDQKTITATCAAENCPSGYHDNGISVTLNVPENLAYDGTAKEATLSGYPDSAVPQLADKPNVVYYKSSREGSTEPDGSALSGAPKDAGNYVAQITWGEKTASAAFTITKADASVTAAPEATNPAWTGTAQKLVSKGTAEGGEMQYALGVDDKTAPEGSWSADVPEAADPNTYFIWYKAAGDENHNDSEAGYVKSTITAKLISYEVTFKVENGAWDDKTTEERKVTLSRYENEDKALVLKEEDIPKAGNEPAEGYMAGSWDATPDTATEIKKDTTYTYTYAKKPVYKVIEGANGKVTKNSGKGLTFKTDGDYAKFTGIMIDDKNVASSLYTAQSGSTIVELKAACIDQLSVGKHTIQFLYTDGSCGTEFEVQAAATPTNTPTPAPTNTGDNNPAGLWMLLLAGSLGSLILVFALRRKMIK